MSDPPGIEHYADLGIPRQRYGAELFGMNNHHFDTALIQVRDDLLQRGNDAVGLRFPCIGDQQQLQARSRWASDTGTALFAEAFISSAQRISLNSPRSSSTSAVHDSTQSPQFM